MVSIGTRIKVMRMIRSLSQTGLAKAAGVGQYDISAYENERSLPSSETLGNIQVALHVDFSQPITIQPDGRLECSAPEKN